ncbi:MAG TPA: IS1380 family transposase [Ignavibacteria bacterium]|nr:IS1380 family transposase [Ignavibacteria bacterium]
MNYKQSDIYRKYQQINNFQFETENQSYSSFSGLIVFQKLFVHLGLKSKLKACFKYNYRQGVIQHHSIMLMLIIHILLGYRELRDQRFYADDPMVKRLLGMSQLPSVSTISRVLSNTENSDIENLRHLNKTVILDRLTDLSLARVTIDFDGSVLSTTRRAEGSAVGFNKKKKGARSYYPLFCTVAQTGQVFDFHHRAGNVHDSNGADAFISDCINQIRGELSSGVIIESRMDSAFFSDQIVTMLNTNHIEFTQSVPFERFPQLKKHIEENVDWIEHDDKHAFFELDWKPDSWKSTNFRFIAVRKEVKKQIKGPIQLDLFVAYDYKYEFKVILTNKTVQANSVLLFHNGRGSQENIFSELKSQAQMDYVPTNTKKGNQLYLLATLFAHNLMRELQMRTQVIERTTTPKRAALWVFEKIGTLRKKMIQRAGRITKPNGILTLTMAGNQAVKDLMCMFLRELDSSAQ